MQRAVLCCGSMAGSTHASVVDSKHVPPPPTMPRIDTMLCSREHRSKLAAAIASATAVDAALCAGTSVPVVGATAQPRSIPRNGACSAGAGAAGSGAGTLSTASSIQASPQACAALYMEVVRLAMFLCHTKTDERIVTVCVVRLVVCVGESGCAHD